MLYILLRGIDDPDRADCGTSWGVYEAESPEEVLERTSVKGGIEGQEPFFLVEAGQAFGPKPGLQETKLQDHRTGDDD